MTDTGTVLSIHRASLHDGPGIRTTVFLKGCPLRCAWCHNPESQRTAPELAFRAERCTGCGRCAAACPQQAHRLVDGQHRFDREACIACGACTGTCQALELYGSRKTVAECLAPVLADRPYYRRSGGGMTVSGGEPLAQPAFTAALLAAARCHGIHTCLETCGHATDAALDAVLPHVDLVLFDSKASDDALHQLLTGVGLERIHRTRDRLRAAGVPVILRCPLVPGVNDDDEHLAAIAAWSRASTWPVEVMPFHTLGLGKAAALGRPAADIPQSGADPHVQRHWLDRLRQHGAIIVRLG
jgi:pyruvate formate lyase activating enzyme